MMPSQADSVSEVTIRIVLTGAPPSVRFALQRGKVESVDTTVSSADDLAFSVPVRVRDGRDGQPDFAGSFVQGPPGERFIYICSGVRAGDIGSGWDRRAKVPLNGITQELLEQARTSGGTLAVTIPGRMKDGGPVCAGVRIAASDWKVREEKA